MHRFDSFQVREPVRRWSIWAWISSYRFRSSSARFASDNRLPASSSAYAAILGVGVGKDLLPHDVEEPNEEAARTAGRVANDVAFLRIDHADHEFNDGSRGEELADFAAERLAQEPLEGDALYVFAGVGKVVAFQQPDDFAPRGQFQVQPLPFVEDAVFAVVFLGLAEKLLKRVFAKLRIEPVGRKEVLPLPLAPQFAFDPNLDEQHLGDFVEGRRRVQVFAVANDVVAGMEQVGKFVFLERLQLLDKLLNFLVAGVGMGDVLDFLDIAPASGPCGSASSAFRGCCG